MSECEPQTSPRVVFIVSQPRAGSTLLQTMLGGHPKVIAPGETWMMLPLVHAVSGATRAVESPYDGYLADHAINLFAQDHLSGGIGDLQKEIGRAAERIYHAACRRANADVLIDKTPRYYWIIEDLLRMLPESQVIILVRNPLAVLSSMLQVWASRGSAGSLASYRADLLEAPARLANAIDYGDNRVHAVRYEQLVTDTESELAVLQEFMGLPVVDHLSHYGQLTSWQFWRGDQQGIRKDTAANQKSLEKWLRIAATNASMWRLLDDYRESLGPELLRRLGYDEKNLSDKLLDVQPPGTSIAPSLYSLVSRKPIEPVRSIVKLRSLCAKAVSRVARPAA